MNEQIKIELPEINLNSETRERWKLFYQDKLKYANSNWQKDIWNFLLNWVSEDHRLNLKTSGSTGEPKQILIKKETMLFSARQTIDYFQFNKNEKWLLCLPAGFVGGQMVLVRAMLCGAEVFAVDPKIEWKADGNFDFASMIPMQTEHYLNSNTKIKRILIGGASIPATLEARIKNENETEFYASYGMTETVSHIALRKLNGKEASEYFTPFKNILIGKDDRDCLTIYHRNYSEDVIVTNDLVEFDQYNRFKIIGRADFIINSGGLKIIPEEIERIVSSLIKENNLLIGIKDEITGEKLVLLIEGKTWDKTTLSLFQNHLKDKTERNKCPKEIYFLDRFIFTENGKLSRSETKDYFLKSFPNHL